MKMKIVLLALAFCLLVPGLNAFAYEGGLLHKVTMFSGNDAFINQGTVVNATDGSLTTKEFVPSQGGGRDTLWYTFPKAIDIDHYQLREDTPKSMELVFYDVDRNVILKLSNVNGTGVKTNIAIVSNVKTVALQTAPYDSGNVFEFDVFGVAKTIEYNAVNNLTAKPEMKSIQLDWTNPISEDFTGIKIKKNGVEIATLPKSSNGYEITELEPDTLYKMEVLAIYSDGMTSSPVAKEIRTKPVPPPLGEIQDLKNSALHDSVSLNWINPADDRLKEINVYRDGVKIATVTNSSYRDLNVKPETNYLYKVTTVSLDGKESTGITSEVKTLQLPRIGEIQQLEVEKTHERVNLSWELPKSEILKHVNIYRDEIKDIALLDKVLGFTSVSAAATTKIFETNGTYFNDLTVKPETEYEYTLTTLDTLNRESAGVTTVVKTEEEPAPAIIGGGYTKDPETGDFIYSWKEPTKGSVKVKVDGKEYKTVPAADGKITIPKADMKYDAFGDPLISVQPIGENGKAGEELSESTIKDLTMPFSPKDLLGSSMGLVMVIGGFVLLALSFLFVPKIVRMIKRAIGKESEKEKIERIERAKARVERQGRTGREKAVRTPATDRERMKAEQAVQMAKAPRVPRERASVGRSTKAPRIPRESNRRERPTRPGRG